MAAQDVEAAREFYTRISRVYDAIADSSEHSARDLGLQLLDARLNERILEIGFGTGTAIVPIAQAVGADGHVVGVDVSEGMCEVAAERVALAHLSAIVDLHFASVPPIPGADRSFDAVFMAFTLELFPDDVIPLVLREIRRVLKVDGRFVVVAMDEGDASQQQGLAGRTYQWLHDHFPHIVDCRPIDVDALLRDAGLATTDARMLDIWGLSVRVCLSRA